MVEHLLAALLAKAPLDEVYPDAEGRFLAGHLALELPYPGSEPRDAEQGLDPVREVTRDRDLDFRPRVHAECPGLFRDLHRAGEPFLERCEVLLHGRGAGDHHHLSRHGETYPFGFSRPPRRRPSRTALQNERTDSFAVLAPLFSPQDRKGGARSPPRPSARARALHTGASPGLRTRAPPGGPGPRPSRPGTGPAQKNRVPPGLLS